MRIVALGGGTGLPVLLRGLRGALPAGGSITAIATVADDGGSSGKLRAAYRVPSPGDIRNCLLALADGDPAMADVFNFRFDGEGDVGGHSLGNLILTALAELEQDFGKAVERSGRMLAIRGRVLPSTPDSVVLTAELADGTVIEGESRLAGARSPIRRMRLQPADASALPEARQALETADLIVIGPGSLYSSLVAVLLVEDLADAIARSRARVVFVLNLMSEPGETDHHTGVDHVLALRRHAPSIPIHNVLVNTAPIPREQRDRYAGQGAVPVAPDLQLLRALGHEPVERDLLATGPDVRHDPDKLARAILERVA